MYRQRRKSIKSADKLKKAEQNVKVEGRVPLWEIDDVNDSVTVISQIVSEAMVKDGNFDMRAIKHIDEDSGNDINKSDFISIVSGALLSRIGLEEQSKVLLDQDDTVRSMYKSLGLENKAVVNTIVTLVTIMNPELISIINAAALASIRSRSKKERFIHSASRVSAVMNGLIESETVDREDINYAIEGTKESFRGLSIRDMDQSRYIEELSPKEVKRALLQKQLEDLEDEISVDDSISNSGLKSAKQANTDKQLVKPSRAGNQTRSHNSKRNTSNSRFENEADSHKISSKGKSRVGISDTFNSQYEDSRKRTRERKLSELSEGSAKKLERYSTSREGSEESEEDKESIVDL